MVEPMTPIFGEQHPEVEVQATDNVEGIGGSAP